MRVHIETQAYPFMNLSVIFCRREILAAMLNESIYDASITPDYERGKNDSRLSMCDCLRIFTIKNMLF